MQVRESGFTLIELIIAVSVLFITIGLAVPAFQELIQRNRLSAATNDLLTALNLARSEAVKRGVRVTLCKSASGTSCTNAGGWDQGWILFPDPDGDAQCDGDNGPDGIANNADDEGLLRAGGAVADNLTTTGNGNLADYVSYVARGNSALISGGFQAGTITICDDRTGDFGRKLVISSTGRVRSESGVSCP